MTGNDALARGQWTDARRAFEAALAGDETPEALEGLALAAWWLDDERTVFDARARAYTLYLEREDRRSAARVAVWIAWDCRAFRGETAVSNGWLQRAHRHLEGLPESPELAWLEARESQLTLGDDGDPDRAYRLLNNQVIADRLFVSEHTIHRHVANIFTKLSVSSRAAAVAQAARRGIL
jgi:regulatory LuxR family protein